MVFEVASPFLSHDRLRVGLPHTIYYDIKTKQTNKQKNPSYRLQLIEPLTVTQISLKRKSGKWHTINYLKIVNFCTCTKSGQYYGAGNRQLIWRPPSHSQFCIIPTGHKLLTCLLTLHTLFYHADHCYHNTCHTQMVLSQYMSYWDGVNHFETFMRWVTHDTGHLNPAHQRWKQCCNNNTQVFSFISSYHLQ